MGEEVASLIRSLDKPKTLLVMVLLTFSKKWGERLSPLPPIPTPIPMLMQYDKYYFNGPNTGFMILRYFLFIHVSCYECLSYLFYVNKRKTTVPVFQPPVTKSPTTPNIFFMGEGDWKLLHWNEASNSQMIITRY